MDSAKGQPASIDSLLEVVESQASAEFSHTMDYLADTIRDLARQDSTEYRAQFFGECMGLVKAVFLLGLISEHELNQWRADILAAHKKALESCAMADEEAGEKVIHRTLLQIHQLKKVGIVPRERLPR